MILLGCTKMIHLYLLSTLISFWYGIITHFCLNHETFSDWPAEAGHCALVKHLLVQALCDHYQVILTKLTSLWFSFAASLCPMTTLIRVCIHLAFIPSLEAKFYLFLSYGTVFLMVLVHFRLVQQETFLVSLYNLN